MPEGLLDPAEEMIINNVSFPQEGVIEVSYSEKRDHSEVAGIVKTIYIDIDKVKVGQQVEEVVDTVRYIIDEALLAIRKPPARFTPGGRAVRRGDDSADPDMDE